MTITDRPQPNSKRFFSVILSGALLVGCASSIVSSQRSLSEAETSGEAITQPSSSAPVVPIADVSTDVPRTQPQLVKTAELVISVESVETSINAVQQIIQQQQGDLLRLQDAAPTNDRSHHTATIQIRVAQTRLESALQALKALGTVQRQSISAEDVSDQLVDYQARLRNLRKTEETLLGIMERSGEVSDVLKVAQELSNVRNSIEQITAQLTNLQNRVAFSTINLSLQETIANLPPQRSTETQVQETWNQATRSLNAFTVDLLQLGIWLLVYSPYWLVLAGVGLITYSRLKPRQPNLPTPNTDPPSST